MERAEHDQWRAKEVARLLALVETERRYYQDIVATLPIGLLVVSAELRIISANRAFRRTFNLNSEQVLRQRIEDVLPLEGLTALIEEIILSGGTRQHILYEPEATPGGRFLRVSIASVRDWEEESEREALLLVEDLTDIRAALAPSAEPGLEEAPAAPPEMALAIHWETDAAALEIRPLNDGLAALLGYAPEQWEAPGFWWRAVAAADAGWVGNFLRQAAVEGEIGHCDHRMRAADGRTVWVRSVVRPVLDPEGAVTRLTGVTIDITPAREREQQLVEARVLDAMALWSGRLTHDFNNLLMIVTGYSREILDSLPARDARRGDLQEILRTAERVSGMVRELMTLSRPPIAEPQQLDLNEAVREMEARLAEIAGKASLRLSLDPDAGLVSVDPAHLESMVATLVKQAAQVAGAGATIAIQTSKVETGARYASPDAPPRSCVKLKVRPQNVTVDAETRERLFEPLLAAKEPELAPGLFPICGIVRQAEGEVRIEQEPGGTVFALYLPRIAGLPGAIPEAPLEAPAEPAPHQAEPAEAPREQAPSSQEAPAEIIEIPIAEAPAAETVLVVEDDPGIRALMRKILLRQGFVVLEAASGQESIKLAERRQGPIQLLITDLMMPEMSGREVAERLKAARPDIKVVFISGFTDDPMIQSGQLPEGTVFLQKPFTLGALLDKVRDVLGHDAPAE